MAAAGSSPCQPIPLTDLSLHLPVNGSFVAAADGLTEASVCERRNASAGGILLVRGLVNPAGVRATTTPSALTMQCSTWLRGRLCLPCPQRSLR